MSFSHRWKQFWESQNSPLHNQNNEEFFASHARELRLLLNGVKCERILEIGCGNGALFKHLEFHLAQQYRGVDVSAKMIEKFRKQHPQVTLSVADGHTYEDNEKYDLIFSNGVVQYFTIPMLEDHLQRSKRMLAAGGVLVCGSVPWLVARNAYRRGGLMQGKRGGFTTYLLSTVKQSLSDSMGRWYRHDELSSLAEKHGLSTVFFGSLHYPYRFHVVLRRLEDEPLMIQRAA